MAVIVPEVLVMPVTVMPVAVPPAICVTVKLPAAVCASATVPTVTAAPAGVPCCREIAAAGVKLGALLALVSEKLTETAPFALAETVYGPPMIALAVTVPEVAAPPAMTAGLPAMLALAPLTGGVNVTWPPLVGSLLADVTVTRKGEARAVVVTAL